MEILAASILTQFIRSIIESIYMFWETLWALGLGFMLSGAVQAFTSKSEMDKALGNHNPKTVVKASGLGAVSSSCSYAASAMAKSLFVKGADFISAIVFMFASTNLVIELGIVLVVLMGWQFMAAEFIGGPIMIMLLVILGSFFFTPTLIEAARSKLRKSSPSDSDLDEQSVNLEKQPWSVRLKSVSGWADAASYTMADLTMLRREMFFGYLIAGFLAVMVPVSFWNILFIPGNGIWTQIENAIIGPIIALLSFVCSIGNVPLAAALWHGGISFGGVISFIFADLIAMPLVLIYRKFYGGILTKRLFFVFWATMSTAGLIVDLIFSALKLVPSNHLSTITTAHFSWGYTTFLNILFIVILSVLYWLYKNRQRFGGSNAYAIDPICGMQVEKANAPAFAKFNDSTFYFCSDRCYKKFIVSPERFIEKDSNQIEQGESMASDTVIDPVCKMEIDPKTAAAHSTYNGTEYYFCNISCAQSFEQDPSKYV